MKTDDEEALVSAGYNVSTRSDDRQFVDVWIEFSWRKLTLLPL